MITNARRAQLNREASVAKTRRSLAMLRQSLQAQPEAAPATPVEARTRELMTELVDELEAKQS